ncbi:MAG: hypothetical protein ACRDPR_20090 [Nocardioidaceae bacterium]
MSRTMLTGLRRMEGRAIGLALADGTRIDGATLVSARSGRVARAWVFVNGADRFVYLADITDYWEDPGLSRRRRPWEDGA